MLDIVIGPLTICFAIFSTDSFDTALIFSRVSDGSITLLKTSNWRAALSQLLNALSLQII